MFEADLPTQHSESITVMGDAKQASSLEIETFLKLLADITKRIVTEEVPTIFERRAS